MLIKVACIALLVGVVFGAEYSELTPGGGQKYGHDSGPGGYHHAEVAPGGSVRGTFGHTDGKSGQSFRTEYSAGRAGFIAQGAHLTKRGEDLGLNARLGPKSIIPPPSKAYEYSWNAAGQSRREASDAFGDVRGRYSYVDDVGIRRTVDYSAGRRKGFIITDGAPDPPVSGPAAEAAYYRPSRRNPPPGPAGTRGYHSSKLGSDGSYRFTHSSPTQRHTERKDAFGRVQGEYSFVDDRGTRHRVQYEAGPNIGFRVIRRDPPLPGGPNLGGGLSPSRPTPSRPPLGSPISSTRPPPLLPTRPPLGSTRPPPLPSRPPLGGSRPPYGSTRPPLTRPTPTPGPLRPSAIGNRPNGGFPTRLPPLGSMRPSRPPPLLTAKPLAALHGDGEEDFSLSDISTINPISSEQQNNDDSNESSLPTGVSLFDEQSVKNTEDNYDQGWELSSTPFPTSAVTYSEEPQLDIDLQLSQDQQHTDDSEGIPSWLSDMQEDPRALNEQLRARIDSSSEEELLTAEKTSTRSQKLQSPDWGTRIGRPQRTWSWINEKQGSQENFQSSQESDENSNREDEKKPEASISQGWRTERNLNGGTPVTKHDLWLLKGRVTSSTPRLAQVITLD